MINLVLIGVYVILFLFWTILIICSGKKYDALIEPLSSKSHPLKKLYPIGFEFLRFIKYKYNSNYDRKRISQSIIVFGERYGEYYYRVNVAEKFTYFLICVTISPLLGLLFGTPYFSLFGVFAGGMLFYYADTKITDVIKKREEEIGRDFADVVSKMALLINAGMITRDAWEKISENGEGALYEEMRASVDLMNNGYSEVDAYIEFSNRCGVQYIKKFISMLVQNISKGNSELVSFLTTEGAVCWEEKKHIVKRQGEAAANKLMIPLGMILVGVFIMILVPVLSNLNI